MEHNKHDFASRFLNTVDVADLLDDPRYAQEKAAMALYFEHYQLGEYTCFDYRGLRSLMEFATSGAGEGTKRTYAKLIEQYLEALHVVEIIETGFSLSARFEERFFTVDDNAGRYFRSSDKYRLGTLLRFVKRFDESRWLDFIDAVVRHLIGGSLGNDNEGYWRFYVVQQVQRMRDALTAFVRVFGPTLLQRY